MRREMPYQPMRGPQKAVSETDMQSILQKHAQRIAVPIPQPKREPEKSALITLEWNTPERGATGVRTVCGRYSCSKVTVQGKTTYEVWRLVPDHWFRQIAIGLDNFETGKRLANEHVNGQVKS